ncbi:unnamed protein product [Lepeophtheirus salmonis]|uniref:(salmon louse) hypothetical protein n=1 Tax=Lepeophtheirus salmonis TaxID=72036 RepID=A0A7R8CP60_LEPSM|nr:unnamed protein product [Lepeophtheirus salmonis]CAF2850711.1 unnamed protein product [Lepeophtheirus salmonis]
MSASIPVEESYSKDISLVRVNSFGRKYDPSPTKRSVSKNNKKWHPQRRSLMIHFLNRSIVSHRFCCLVKYFRNNHHAGAKYRQEDFIKIYVTNWLILMKICEVKKEVIDPAVRSKVSNIGLKHSAEELFPRFQPIVKALHQGKELNKEEMNMTIEYANEIYPMKFQGKSPPFQAFMFTEPVTKTMSDTEWWEPQASFMGSHVIQSKSMNEHNSNNEDDA